MEKQYFPGIIDGYCVKYPFLNSIVPQVREAIHKISICLKNNGKLLICGNGGSNADADHMVGELLKEFRKKRPLPVQKKIELKKYGQSGEVLAERLQGSLPAINLGAQTSIMTAILNDIGGEFIFAQQVNGLCNKGDILIGISTSGNSVNVLHAGRTAKINEGITIGLTGNGKSDMDKIFDVCIHAPSSCTEEIQNQHTVIYHLICAVIENEFWSEEK